MIDYTIRILLVEDNPADAGLLSEDLLDSHRNFEIVHADRLSQAAEFLADRSFDIILLDLSLPDSLGLNTITAMQKFSGDVPIIILTGNNDEKLGIEAVALGVQDYLVKGEIPQRLLIRAIDYALERRRSQARIERLVEELRNKNAELESIIGVVSHDLRTPLVNIRGFTDELIKDTQEAIALMSKCNLPSGAGHRMQTILAQSMPEAVNFIQNSAAAIDQLIKGLLQVARAGLVVLNPAPVDMNQLMNTIIKNVSYKLSQGPITLEIGELPPCVADPDQVSQVFSNLVDNAIKYLQAGRAGIIRVWATRQKGQVVYCVEDNGRGIEEKYHDKIFDIFYRMDTSRSDSEGLGLAIVKRIVDRHNGRIWVESQPGKGSRFFVALPATNQ